MHNMASKLPPLSLVWVIFLTLYCLHNPSLGVEDSRNMYIVYMKEKIHGDPTIVSSSHFDLLASILGSKEEANNSIVHSYKHGFSGFAAMLNESFAEKISGLPEVLTVQPSKNHHLHTTRSWDFLGLDYNQPSGLLHDAKKGEGIIIGIVDTGIWPESPSFIDDGYGPPPSRWRGTCVPGSGFTCNKKIIGARFYGAPPPGGFWSPRDENGHGTHTASTAAGSLVFGASYHGLTTGAARGGAPRAYIAVYKVCWGVSSPSCPTWAILAAIDDAINDGVDVLSLSLGGGGEIPGTLYAVSKGISVVFSAGNDGPAPQTVENAVPWVVTVAAGTIDRSFPTVITLGNQRKLVGQSLYYDQKSSSFTNIYYFDICDKYTLNTPAITGKIVFCYGPSHVPFRIPRNDLSESIDMALSLFAAGLIFAQYTTNILEDLNKCGPAQMPCVIVDFKVAQQILNYIKTTGFPTANIVPARATIGEIVSPKIAAFSSRGPSASFLGILKPDIAAPGVSILAAVGGGYELMSGTSMACPHVSGIVALLKSIHPKWSPAAIKSALVTTASVVDRYRLPILEEGLPRKYADPFDFGGGFANPKKAADPGLVYDIDPKDFTSFFGCSITPDDNCWLAAGPLYNLNLPSISIPNLKTSLTVPRTVTNVGNPNSVYHVSFQSPPGVTVTVQPNVLAFNPGKQKQTFAVTFTANQKVQGDYAFGSLTWSDGVHSVRIPIAVRVVIQDFYAEVA